MKDISLLKFHERERRDTPSVLINTKRRMAAASLRKKGKNVFYTKKCRTLTLFIIALFAIFSIFTVSPTIFSPLETSVDNELSIFYQGNSIPKASDSMPKATTTAGLVGPSPNTTNSIIQNGMDSSTNFKDNGKTKPTTGSFVNCVENNNMIIDNDYNSESLMLTNHDNIYYGKLMISCTAVNYRISSVSSYFQNAEAKTEPDLESNIIVGVLSNASGDGPSRRESIRKTWASNLKTPTNDGKITFSNGGERVTTTFKSSVYFLVAGPWDQIVNEFNKYHDLIWIDQEEVYRKEKSVLTLKTYSFMSIIQNIAETFNYKYTHVFKTDDDSYVDLNALHMELVHDDNNDNESNAKDYVGHCQLDYTKVIRDAIYKWPLTTQIYPETYFPGYCQGAGYALSHQFLKCAFSQKHIAKVRFMPFEDVAVGIVAERCHIQPSQTKTGEIKVSRYESRQAKELTKFSKNRHQYNNTLKYNFIPIAACMTTRIVQHRVIDDEDMHNLHKTVLDPGYCKTMRRKRGRMIQNFEKKGLEWFG